ncbi:MAG: SIS domain-containing protein [Lachnospiraceae bacterium]|nr:SIS domain-containing protein [Lachnospiraceae bacterium]MBQ8232138.1 SIS domain-containing protein [Lachnospiraceae bacterium]
MDNYNLSQELNAYVDELIERYPVLDDSREDIVDAYLILEESYLQGGKLLAAGNGGSAADANHIVGELMKGFCLPRKMSQEFADKLKAVDEVRGAQLAEKLQGALPAIALDNHNALNTAFLNDVDGTMIYAQQVNGYGNAGDVFLGITTSGNAGNVMYAAVVAKAKGLKVIGLTGKTGGKLAGIADVCIRVNETETYKVQELHLPIYHCLCLMVEHKFFG